MLPFPPIERWRLPEVACELTLNAVMPAGRRGCESGVLWLGQRDALSVITAVVHPIGEGVEETSCFWSISPEAYAAVSAWARPRRLTLLAVAHIHLGAGRARMSETDRKQGLKVTDALSIIVPRGGLESDPSAWGWFVFDEGDYRELEELEQVRRIELTSTGEVEFARIDTGTQEPA